MSPTASFLKQSGTFLLYYIGSLHHAYDFILMFGIEFINDTVGQTDNRYIDIFRLDDVTDGSEDITCRNNYIRTVRLQVELLYRPNR